MKIWQMDMDPETGQNRRICVYEGPMELVLDWIEGDPGRVRDFITSIRNAGHISEQEALLLRDKVGDIVKGAKKRVVAESL